MSTITSLAYLEDYLDTFEALPLELTKQLTMLRELDSKSHAIMEQTAGETPAFLRKINDLEKETLAAESIRITELFKDLIKHGQDKVKLATQTYDVVERHIRRLDADLAKFEEEQMTGPKVVSKVEYKYIVNENPAPSTTRPRRTGDTPKKRKNEEVYKDSPPSPQKPIDPPKPNPEVSPKKVNPPRQRKPEPVEASEQEIIDDIDADPNEPTYCICDRVSFGEMIACDNDDCAREWFHYTCVGLTGPVKGKWFCPACTEMLKN